MSDLRKHSSTSNLIRFTLKNATTGVGLTGLSSASAGLIISTICDNEATATVYTVTATNVETITTLGTYAAPTASKCRFKEVDAVNHKGLYEFQFADARFSVASAKRLVVSVTGATSLLDADYEIQLVQFDPYDAVRGGMTALPSSGTLAVNPVLAATQTGVTIPTVTTLTNAVASVTGAVGSVTGSVGSVAGAVASVTGSVGSVTGAVGSVTAVVNANMVQILGTALTETAGLIAAGVKKFFDVATPTGTVNSIPNAVAGAAGGISIVGSVMGKSPATLAAADVTGNLPVDVKAITVGVDFSATQKASITTAVPTVVAIQSGLATPTNITAGTITTVTTVTNPPANMALDSTVAKAATVALDATVAKEATLTGAQAEPVQGTPAANASPLTKLAYLYKALTNRITQTSTQLSIYNSAGTAVDHKATFADDGTTADRGGLISGP